jgi:hypothetical protein
MAVVINEFEVVPAEPRAADRATPAPREAGPPKDPDREIERHLRQRVARAIRLRAV